MDRIGHKVTVLGPAIVVGSSQVASNHDLEVVMATVWGVGERALEETVRVM